jgi:putative ABC transport system permease protein
VIRDLILRLRALVRRGEVEREIDEELRFHIEQQADAYERAGMDPAAAMRRARLEFGGVEQIKEDYRDALGVRVLDDIRRDLRVAFRSLRATPAVTAVAVLSLALAIGANSAVFTIIDGLMLRALPVAQPDRLVLVTDAAAAARARAWNAPIWEQVSSRQLFERTAAWSFTRFNLSEGGEARFVEGLWASGGFFETLGVETSLGRTLTAQDDVRGGGAGSAVAMVSNSYWRRQLGASPDVIGRTVRLNGVPFTIVGVTEPSFFGPEVGRTFDFVVPLSAESIVRGPDAGFDSCCTTYLTIMARLKPEQSLDGAANELRAAQPAIREATLGAWTADVSPEVVARHLGEPLTLIPAATGFSDLRSRYQRPVLVVGVVVALVLAIACLNVANLLIARSIARRHELSARLALGASRWQLLRQLLAEGLVLSGAGAVLGVVIAAFSSSFLVRQLSTPTSVVFLDVSIGGRALAFTVAVTALTTLIFGAAPAFRAAGIHPMEALNGAGRGTTQPTTRVTEWLVVVQVALSVVLVVAAGLFIQSFASLASRPLGIQTEQVLVVTMNPERTGVDAFERVALYEHARDAVLELPNVAAAAVSHVTPVGGGGFTPSVEISDVAGTQGSTLLIPPNRDVFGNLISSRWFSTFGTRLVAGRDFTDADRTGAPRVAVVNETFARRLFGPANPLGHTITVYPNTPRALTMEIVGVATDAVYTSPRDPAPPTWYAPIAQFDVAGFGFATGRLSVRAASGSPALLADDISRAIASVHPELSLTFRSLADQVSASLTRERLMAQLAGFFGGVALLLAGLGLFGLTSYAVSRRRAEMGVRLALGARPSSVAGGFLKRIVLLVGLGLVVGGGVARWATRFVRGLIYDIPAEDPATLIGAAVLLLAVGILAGWIPARRVNRIDPVEVLRRS